MKHPILENKPDDVEAKGKFVVRPEWAGNDEEDDSWEVARPVTYDAQRAWIFPGAICKCPSQTAALAVCDALNAYVNEGGLDDE